MLLKQLKLQNIRSYREITVNFAPGSTLLAGDIGSGKSTLLLAIEFALFGISKTDLTGESLLRKGSTQGKVELTFQVHHQGVTEEAIICRQLKKAQDSVKQLSGYLITNGQKKELTPVELKAGIIALLGYPEETLTKGKNYLFRYTVYTPQEEMKLILQEDSEERLKVLRQIFNLDKYQHIRENLQNYLKQMRATLAVLESKVEPLEEHQKKIEELRGEKNVLEHSLQSFILPLEQVQCFLRERQQELEQMEQKQKKFWELGQQLHHHKVLLEDKKEQLFQLNQRTEQLSQQVRELEIPSELTVEEVKLHSSQLDHEKSNILARKSSLLERLAQLQKSLTELKSQMDSSRQETVLIPEKEKHLAELEIIVNGKEKFSSEKLLLEPQMEENSNSIAKHQLLLTQSRELQRKILSLEKCPTCLQEVREEHKHSISTEEQSKIGEAEKALAELLQNRTKLRQHKEELLQQLEQVLRADNQLSRLRIELKHLQQKKELLGQQEELRRLRLKENELLVNELEELQQGRELEKLLEEIGKQQELLQKLLAKRSLQQQLEQLSIQLSGVSRQISLLSEQIHELANEKRGYEDLSERIAEQKKEFQKVLNGEKELAVKIAQVKTSIESLHRQEQPLQAVIQNLITQKALLIHRQELYHWLNEHLLLLVEVIEKQMMINIHLRFNQLFQEWFSILLEDEQIASRVDESFTPIIEQNGYEISFANLSGGEKTSAALAYRLALNRVINDVVHGINTKELLILDEPTDGFSSEQLDKVREVLDRLKLGQVLIVSHESKMEAFVENVIRVRKEGNESEVG